MSGITGYAGAQPTADFVTGLSDAERAAIGLAEMSPAQQAALEQAVARYVAGRSAAAVESALDEKEQALAATTERLVAAEAELAQQRAEVAAVQEREKSSLLERARVLLTPGTQIEYATVNSHLREEFRGWNEGTLLRLENGQVWQVTGTKDYWSPRRDAGLAVTIEPGSFGSFFMKIEGVKSTPKVELVSRR